MTHNAAVNHPLNNARTVIQPSWPAPPVYILGTAFYSLEYLFGWFRSAILAMLPPSFLYTCSLSGHGKLKNHWLRINTTQQEMKSQCVIKIVLIRNPKHINVPATSKKTDFIPTETRHAQKVGINKHTLLEHFMYCFQ